MNEKPIIQKVASKNMQMEKDLHRKSNAALFKFANKESGITFTICFGELTQIPKHMSQIILFLELM